jgi:hypothetical protein
MKIKPVYKCRNCLVRFALDPIRISVDDFTTDEAIDNLITSFNIRMEDGKSIIKFEHGHIRMMVSHKCNAHSIGFAELSGLDLL